MRRLDENPMDPEIAAQLDAIDATLAGDAVDPEYAELAELALLLVAERPEMDHAAARSLDERVEHRFVARSPRPNRWRWWMASAGGLAAAGVAAIAIVATLPSGGGPSTISSSAAEKLAAPARSIAQPSAGGAAQASTAAGTPRRTTGAAPGSVNRSAFSAASAQALVPAPRPSLQPPANGRKIIQSAELDLAAAPSRIDTVAQEVYNVVGRANGVVNRSQITQGGPGGYAQFQLSVPSASLPQTMASLSQLPYARVASRTDATQDVNDQYGADVRRLNDARALRTRLLKQLANAVTDAQIASLKAQLSDAEGAISSGEAALRGLNHQISFSQISVTIAAGTVPVPVHHHSGTAGFTLSKAVHIAGRVLVVAAGVALIVLAGLVPVGLLAALAWWIGAAARRRRREQALDVT